MPAKRRPSRWSFDTTADLVAWMESEYLSELTLEALDPEPGGGAAPTSVRFTWLLHGTGEGRIVPYEVTADEVQTWTLEGTRDDEAVSVVGGDGPGVHLVLEVPGRLTLRCGRLTVSRRPARKKPVKVRPHTDYMYFGVTSERPASFADVLEALGAPEGAELVTPRPVDANAPIETGKPFPIEVRVGGAAWVTMFNMTAAGSTGFQLSISRKGATDGEWRRAQELPRLLGPTFVGSAWEFEGTDAEWTAMLARSDEAAR